MKLIVLLGRLLFSIIFLLTVTTHFSSKAIEYAAAKGLPYANILVPLSAIIAALGALSIILGYKARFGAWLIILFLIPVTLVMHNFWKSLILKCRKCKKIIS